MNNTYDKVPDIITGKDLDYLSDMFEWNYESYKKSSDYLKKVNDMEIKEMIERVANFFHGNMATILSILDKGGQNE